MWVDDQDWERAWWSNCCNTLSEELKQLAYFKRLGLVETKNSKWRFAFDMQGKSVLDIGGGPASFLLKCVNVQGLVVDPCYYPDWIANRYACAGIRQLRIKGEALLASNQQFDEVWIYNVLQHVEDPEKIVQNARRAGKLVRFFDWIDAGVHPGHPHNFTAEQFERWFEAKGTVEDMNENDAFGRCWYGVFPQ